MTNQDAEVVEWVKNPQGPGLVKKAAVEAAATTEKTDEAAIKKPLSPVRYTHADSFVH